MMRTGRSLLHRMLWLHATAMVATAIIVAGAAYLFLDSTADRLQRQTLLAHAERLANGLTISSGRVQIRADAAAVLAGSGASFNYTLIDGDGQTRFGARLAPPLAARVPRTGDTTYFRVRSRNFVASGVSLPVRVRDARYRIVVVQNLEHPDVIFDDILRQFLPWGAALIGAVLLPMLAIDVLLARRALRPLGAAAVHVRALDVHDLDVRVPLDDMPTEIRPFADAINQALDRVAEGYRVQRDFIADAAHELRTPLAVARMRAAALAAPEGASIRNDLDAMGRIVGQLLDIAAAESAPSPLTERADLVAIAEDAVAGMAPLAIGGGRTLSLEASADTVTVRGASHLIARALDALIENALHHTPVGTDIRVGVRPDGSVSVIDNGPGVSAADREHLFRRFWRGDRSQAGRSGLGLAIADRVVSAHDGRISYAPSAPRGSIFTMRFHLAPTSPDANE